METRSSVRLRATPKVVVTLAIVVVVLWAVNMAAYWLWPSVDAGNRGIFGDIFGVSASLFSALAFAGLIIAILLQKEELEYQREELRLTREEMRGQKEQLEGQKRQMEIQNFENRFFQMVAMWNELRRHFEPRYAHEGKIGFEGLKNEILSYVRMRQSVIVDKKADELAIIDDGVKAFYLKPRYDVKSYFRVLSGLTTIVDRADISFDDQKFYAGIVTALLSQHESAVIFYMGLSSQGRKDFKPLIEKYSLLKHLDKGDLISAEHMQLYSPSAFA